MSKVSTMFKGFGKAQKNGILLRMAIAVILTSMLIMCIASASYSNSVSKNLADNLIRLHVIANSDSKEDQDLKRSVRDKILQYMQPLLKDSKDIEHTNNIINQNMNKILDVAKKEIERQGKSYTVSSTLGSYPFPTKAYGDITLPAGYYQALRVIIGKGEGANWWCVLFPPLCFVDATHGTLPDSVKKNLEKSLGKEEYRIITSTDSDEKIPIKIKFKVVEFFQDAKIKVCKFFSKLF